MNSAMRDAHERLMATLRVRTHLRVNRPRETKPPDPEKSKPYKRPVLVDGKHYESLSYAQRRLRLGKGKIYRMLEDGRATYEEE